MIIKESLKGNESITDKHMWELIHECIDDIMEKTGYLIEDDLMWLYGEGSHTFGTTYYPQYDGGQFSIVLNKYLINDTDDKIKNTICHELCHYIHNKEMFDDGILYWKDNDTLRYTNRYQQGRDNSHGTRWKEIAREVSRALNLNPPISTRSSISNSSIKDYAQSKAKYIVTCKNCGHKSYYDRLCTVIRLIMNGQDNRLKCGSCKKSAGFTLEKN